MLGDLANKTATIYLGIIFRLKRNEYFFVLNVQLCLCRDYFVNFKSWESGQKGIYQTTAASITDKCYWNTSRMYGKEAVVISDETALFEQLPQKW